MNDYQDIVSQEYSELKSTYLNAAYFGPSPKRCKTYVEKSLKHEIDPSFAPYLDWYERPEKSRQLFANILGVSKENIFHTCSVSDVNNLIIHSLPKDKQHHVVVIDKDYPSNVLPFMLAETRYQNIKFTKISLGQEIIPNSKWLAANLPKDTSIFCCSWVTFDSGKKIDLIDIGNFLRSRNIKFILDATQGLGGLKLGPEEINLVDAVSCASYKWLLGPYGHAFGYIAPKLMAELKHPNGNWITSKNSSVVNSLLNYTTETLPGARCFDRGQTANLLTISCLEGALEFISEIGLENIQNHNKKLVNYFNQNFPKENFDRITPIDFSGNIICLRGKNIDSLQLELDLKDRDIDVSIREGNIRISFHIYNSLAQVDYLLNTLHSQQN